LAITFINNYLPGTLESAILRPNKKPLYGEIWVYQKFLEFAESSFVIEDDWYLKHNFQIADHASSISKIEGQVDFLLLTKYGLLIIEVKGGTVTVDSTGKYSSSENGESYEAQDPFLQVKEYVHTYREYFDKKVFVYKAVIFPHENNFKLIGLSLEGHKDIFFSAKDMEGLSSQGITNKFYEFITSLAVSSRKRIIRKFWKDLNEAEVETMALEKFPILEDKELDRIKRDLFPDPEKYGYDPTRITEHLILNQNYETLVGLRKNRKVIIQGGPGSGKTLLGVKFLANNIVKQQKGLVFCANIFIKTKLEYQILHDHKIEANCITFRIFSKEVTVESIDDEIDFLIFDEAQEYFRFGLYDLVKALEKKLSKPKVLILYDPDQSILIGEENFEYHQDLFLEDGYTHFQFDTNYRCIQQPFIGHMAKRILHNELDRLTKVHTGEIEQVNGEAELIGSFRSFYKDTRFSISEKVVLIHFELFPQINEIFMRDLDVQLEELTIHNVNLIPSKIRYTKAIKYRGMECKSVYLITKPINSSSYNENESRMNKVQNYIGVTRAMADVKIIEWT
jgi:hypothetical protein